MYQFMKQTLIPAVIKHLSDTFRVRETQATSVITQKCAGMVVTKEVLNTEFKADLILFFTAEATKTDSFVAWASPCQLHKTTLRPNVGRVNMNPYYLSHEAKKFFD